MNKHTKAIFDKKSAKEIETSVWPVVCLIFFKWEQKHKVSILSCPHKISISKSKK